MKNSFKNLLLTFSREVILEKASGGQKIDSLTREVGRLVIDALKSDEVFSKISKKIPTSFNIPGEKIERLDIIPVDNIKVNFEFNSALDPQEMRVSGKYNSTPYVNEIQIFVEYPERPFRIKDIGAIYSRIIGGIRHEIEHVVQHFSYGTQKLPSVPKSLEDFIKYYLDPSEVEAYVTEAHMKAVTNKTPISEELEAIFDEALENADAAGLDFDDIDILEDAMRKEYTAYARQRYPKAKF